jgi:putative ABC transport system permease protein
MQTLIAGAAATGVALIVSGLLPSLSLSRGASLAAGAASTARWSGRRWLVASQVAVSVALVAIAGLCARNIVTMAALDTGLALDRVAYAWFDFRVQGWAKERSAPLVERLVARATGMTGVDAAAAVSGLPFKGRGRGVGMTRLERPFASANDNGTAVTQIAGTPAMLRTLGIDLVAGRSFSSSDTASSGGVVVVSAYAARKLFSSTDVVGRQLLRRTYATAEEPRRVDTLTVVGIAADTREESGQPIAAAYVPLSQQYEPSLRLVARTSGDPVAMALALRAAARETDATLGVIDAGTGAQLAGTEAIAFQIMGALAGSLGTAAMALAMIGLYGVLSFVVAQRTREIGIRVALGATTARITRLVLGEGVRPVVEGLIVGFVIADLAEMALRPALQKPLPAIDGPMLLLVPVPFLVAAVIACYVPSRRAAAVDPAVVLRSD